MAKKIDKHVRHEFDKVFLVEEISWGVGGRFLNLDFKTRQPTDEGIVLRHKPMVIDIYQAKEFITRLFAFLQHFEKKYGVIEKPAYLEKLEKELKKKCESKDSKEISKYIG